MPFTIGGRTTVGIRKRQCLGGGQAVPSSHKDAEQFPLEPPFFCASVSILTVAGSFRAGIALPVSSSKVIDHTSRRTNIVLTLNYCVFIKKCGVKQVKAGSQPQRS